MTQRVVITEVSGGKNNEVNRFFLVAMAQNEGSCIVVLFFLALRTLSCHNTDGTMSWVLHTARYHLIGLINEHQSPWLYSCLISCFFMAAQWCRVQINGTCITTPAENNLSRVHTTTDLYLCKLYVINPPPHTHTHVDLNAHSFFIFLRLIIFL